MRKSKYVPTGPQVPGVPDLRHKDVISLHVKDPENWSDRNGLPQWERLEELRL